MKINKILIPAACSLIIAIALYPIFNPGIRRALTLSGFRKAAESMSIIAQEWENAGYDYMFTDRKMYETDTIAVGYRTDDTMPVRWRRIDLDGQNVVKVWFCNLYRRVKCRLRYAGLLDHFPQEITKRLFIFGHPIHLPISMYVSILTYV